MGIIKTDPERVRNVLHLNARPSPFQDISGRQNDAMAETLLKTFVPRMSNLGSDTESEVESGHMRLKQAYTTINTQSQDHIAIQDISLLEKSQDNLHLTLDTDSTKDMSHVQLRRSLQQNVNSSRFLQSQNSNEGLFYDSA